ncbi:thioredoxin [Oceanirhabdus sp. W0125-5]|uniref:thioredoxin n=1 Tax=Oceanirhabdus sp. W0125-5 TaxID=2999116 RepID=UPI0022F34048|nr:thioredoxin [Oceanirhabdus sp. W0125-5]WBW99550.1 thioredoxin [Oceanirhabdus sp. W0125-5]
MLIEGNSMNISQILSSNALAVIDFYAPWCRPCKMLSPLIYELSNENSDVNFIKINVDANPTIAKYFNITSLPTVAFFKNGQFVDVKTGFVPKKILESTIKNYR